MLSSVAFGLEMRGAPKAEAAVRARHSIRLVGLGEFESAFPVQLSGGMAQRVGISRALTVQPEILLLDGRLGALDAMTRITMQDELARIWREQQVTMVLVTHDLEEAIFLADRVLVMPREKGAPPRLIEIDLPHPRDRSESRFVAMRRRLMASSGCPENSTKDVKGADPRSTAGTRIRRAAACFVAARHVRLMKPDVSTVR